MILAPIDSREFAYVRSQRRKDPAVCQLAPLLRLILLVLLGGAVAFAAIGVRSSHAAAPAAIVR
jgi:hypothetical protein